MATLGTAMATYPKPLFNGWLNWQSWHLAMWLTEDQGLYVAAHDAVKVWRREHSAIRLTAEGARQMVTEQILRQGTPDFHNGAADYAGATGMPSRGTCRRSSGP